MMEESSSSTVLDGRITGIRFGLATRQEICTASNSDCPISHASQLSNPFLGLPLEAGKCESCGTAEPGQCEGHFGYIELPVVIYHPSHVGELKRMLSLLCLKCLKMKNRKFSTKNVGVIERALTSCCEEASQVSINEVKTTDGASYLELKLPSKSTHLEGAWDFLERYGFRYGDNYCRPLLPSEVMAMLKKIPAETKKKLAGKGYFSQEGYVMQYLPVPPNCLSVPDVSDGISSMSSDVSLPMLKKVLRQVEVIKSSRSGTPNFESLEVEVNDLQAAVSQYLQARGTKASREGNTRFGFSKELNDSSSTKAWLEKMKTLFISKGSGFSSRSVITGDPFKGVGDIGIPSEIAQRITFEERVNEHNMTYLQKLVDEKLCLTYRDGLSTYSLREGSKGHTFLRPGQVVHRRIMEGDMIFINRPPTTHKHSLQALSVYVHDDHTFKINPLICGPLSADFDGDCIHIFYPQSPEAKAEVLELFAVEKQLLSSHSGNINLQLTSDSLLSLKNMFRSYFYRRSAAQQLSMFCSNSLPKPSLLKAHKTYPLWTAVELLEASLPRGFDCSGERYLIRDSRILKLDFNRDAMQSIINDVVTSIFFNKGPSEVLRFFNSIQPMLMENLGSEGCSLSLEDFIAQKDVLGSIQMDIQDLSPLLHHLRSNYNELIELQLEKHMRVIKVPVANFILKSSSMGNLIDSKSEAGINRIVQQVGFMGLQISDRGKLYSKTLVGDLASLFRTNYPFPAKYPSEEFGLIRTGLFHGLDPYQELVHSISSREVMVRSSRGLTEPGTLFKNLMAILRDVVICYDGTVRNVCSNSIIQFEYGAKTQSLFGAGEPVGVLAATAMSNPAYKAVLDSSPSSNSSWEMMKEILLCRVNFKNDALDRRVVLYLTDCDCGREYCRENAAYMVKNHLKKVSLKDVATEFLIEYKGGQVTYESSETGAGLVGHIHLNKMLLKDSIISMEEVLEKCENTINLFRKKKKVGNIFKRIGLSFSECSFHQTSENKSCPCLKFFWHEQHDIQLERISHIFADTICPVLLETIIKGDPRVREANILWVSPETTTWIRNPSKNQKGELAVDVVLEKEAVKKTGDAWRTVLDSCLPVIHLIDTRRSIPYAIKQVQDLLGISCAFEQAVQRLSTSVSMVTKGVLKDHLVLLANSMTCAGNLVGFNTGGIKALSRTLNVQVPFTEATLFTPKKCFERAAEKCHADSLSSIVASCSWGKHVAVGTGSRFDVLWDTREVELNQKDGIDVYDFLHFVRSGPGGEETDSVCLGGEVDSFDMEADNMGMSPEHNDGVDKPVFEDAAEFDFDLEKQNVDSQTTESIWDKVPSSNVESGGGWGRVIEKPASGGWSKEDHSSSSGWGGTESAKDNNQAGAWGKKVTEVDQSDQTSGWAAAASKKDLGQSGSWGKKDVKVDGTGWNKGSQTPVDQSDQTGGWAAASKKDLGQSGSWGKKDVEVDGTGWNKGSQTPVDQSDQTGGWAAASKKDFGQSGSWESSWGNKVKEADNNGWNSKTDNDGWAAAKKQNGGDSTTKTQASSWGASGSRKDSDQLNTSASWGGNKVKEADGSGWNSKTDNDKGTDTGKQNAWSSAAGTQSSTWGQEKDSGQDWAAIGSKKDSEQSNASGSWGNKVKEADKSGWGRKNDNEDGDPVRKQNVVDGTAGSESGGWGHKEASGSLDWGAIASKKDSDQSSSLASWGRKDEKVNEPEGDSAPKNDEGWGAKKKEDSSNSSNWGNHDKGQDKSGSWGWGGKKVEEKTEETGWKKKDGWGSSKDGDWKNKRDRPARPVGGSNDGQRTPVPYTATRQRLDSFTAEEQDVLSDIEPIMQSIRRIMHQTGYNDGDPLSADDQTYILDNVFKYHPDKAQKMGSGIEYVMVNKHSNFQESRCLYIVSTDGRKEDFSYRKCLENFIREKYPDKVEAFMAKYFKKPQPRPAWNKDNNRGGSGGGPDDSKKPWGGWNNNRPSDGGTPKSGWGSGSKPATEEGGTPRSGWGNKATEEAPEGGTPQSGWGNKATEECGTPPQSGWGNKATEGGGPSQSGWGSGSKPVTEGGTPPQSGWGSGSKTPTEGGGTPGSGWGTPGSTQATEEGGTPKSGWGSGSKTAATEEVGTPRSGWGS